MSEFLASIKADLLDRRLLPLVGVVALCLIGAVAYAALGGSGESSPAAPKSAAAPSASGLAVSPTSTETAVAETTDGVKEQHGGRARNPFTPLPGSKSSTATATTKTSTGSGSSAGGSSGGSGSGTSGSTGASGSSGSSGSGSSGSGSKPAKPKQEYAVTIKLGVVPTGTTAEAASLTEHSNLALNSPLPSAKQALIVFRGVTDKGKSATFTLVSEVILHGVGACLPSAAQCQAVDLQPGEAEELEYIQGNGEPVVYELKVVSIAPITAKASAARRKTAFAQSEAGTALLRQDGLVALPYLRYSSQPGVLVYPQRGAFSARAHSSRRAGRH